MGRYGFGQKEQIPLTGYLDFTGRTYDPAIGNFLQIDPMASDFVSTITYGGFNRNPIRFVDPTGGSVEDRFEEQEDGSFKYIQDEQGTNVITISYLDGSTVYVDNYKGGNYKSPDRNSENSAEERGGVMYTKTDGQGQSEESGGDVDYGPNIDAIMDGAHFYVREYDVGDGEMINAKGHFDDNVTPNVLLPDYDYPRSKHRKLIGYKMALVSRPGDTVSWIDYSLDTVPTDTNTSVARIPKSIFLRKNHHPNLKRIPSVVKNPRP